MKKLTHRNWITLGTSLAVLGVIVWIVIKQWKDILVFPWLIDIKFILLVLIFHTLAVAATFWAWHLMVARMGGFKDIRSDIYFYYVSNLAKRLPTSIPYIGSRLVMYKRAGISQAAIMNCIVLENLLIGMAGVIIFFIFLPFYSSVPKGIVPPMVAVELILITGLLARPQFIIDITNWVLIRFKKEGMTRIPSRRDILIWIGVYTLPWIFAGLSLYFAFRGFSSINTISVMDAIEISTLSTLVSLLYFIVPGGLALKEMTSSALLTAWMPFSIALVITMVYRLLQTANDIFWALVAHLVTAHSIKQAQNTPETPIRKDNTG